MYTHKAANRLCCTFNLYDCFDVAGNNCGRAGHWGKFFEWPSAQSATPFHNEGTAVILRQDRRAYGQGLVAEADPPLPGGPGGNPPMSSALLPQDITGCLLSTVTRQLLNLPI